ncbi:cysteine proteinase [Gloeophyllum trabeum ATCC 11539]|uniref:Cysteine proteinase n=1 Tax=Gloeophyllum trabeum (strain ATCC 11539 / FP-39264 / Madison 617) TaxID=670483 RepID=S7Q8F5_GLOTA|nr:cysteine proteinase [Gloeophyllum trabeum ATCC 11539]EPQ55723.1 cysteine proteinase [Gloeophyllum trabeum ATCC 11539]
MGSSKRHQRSARAPQQMRSRTTRSKGKLLSDPVQNTQDLHQQLRAMGLYAANTLGDGNCLFRALSDQLYGTESYHLQLRQQVCNWIEAHKDRYAPFCDDERGLDTHLRCMRQPATYGGHMELSAFAHMTKRDVKVVQPGLVYVIEWAAGGDFDEPAQPSSGPSSEPDTSVDDPALDARERRRLLREKKREAKERKQKEKEIQQQVIEDTNDEDEDSHATVYVAYYDWEHFSSIRNIRGPHTGPPRVREEPPPDADEPDALPPTPSKKKPPSKVRSRASVSATSPTKPKPAPPSQPQSLSAIPAHLQSETPTSVPSTPSQIPLPPSRSPSPILSSVPPSSQASIASDTYRRSPKRSFDASSGSSQSSEKRVRRLVDPDPDDEDTPALSASGFTTESSASSPEPPPAPVPVPVLTRRERKKLGLPKPRPGMTTRSAGKIVIPGGRYRTKPGSTTTGPKLAADGADEGGEWKKNGTGRVDVRGFRELKI